MSREDLKAALLQQGPQGEETMTTIAEEFIQEGIVESTINFLQIRFGDVPHEIITRLNQIENIK